jgi:hypothetical protein
MNFLTQFNILMKNHLFGILVLWKNFIFIYFKWDLIYLNWQLD